MRDHTRGAAFLIVVPAKHAGPPDAAPREAMRLTAESPVVGLKGMGTFVPSEGSIAASIRSIIMRLNVLTGSNASNLFENANKAADWASSLLSDPEITDARLTEAIQSIQDAPDLSAPPKNLQGVT